VTVPAKNFRPEPNVDSAVILIDDISKKFFKTPQNKGFSSEIDPKIFFKLVKTGFAHKRKVLIGNLSEIIPRETLDNVWISCGLDPKVRAEEIPLTTWGKMLEILTALHIIL
jgi:16S rRNA (adenine1518-N6/adenine1519-N6)-dimethyltransferase